MKNYKDFAVSLAFQAGKIMKQNFVTGMQKEWKEDHTPLTKTDLAINELVLDAVRLNYREHGVLAEEESNFNGEDFVWVCDPIDGTFPFSHGYPTFTFSLALVKNGKPILGLLFDPRSDFKSTDHRRIWPTSASISVHDIWLLVQPHLPRQ